MKGPERLKYFQGNWPTNKGAWYPGEKVLFREKLLFEDFKDRSWMSLYMYGIKGEMPTPEQARMLEVVWIICASFPDPRIWNNRIAALAGTARSTSPLAIGAATAASEATIYGRKPDLLGSSFLHEAHGLKDDETALRTFVLSYMKKYRGIPGFGRPLISEDERIIPLMKEVRKLLGNDLEFIDLIKSVENIIQKSRYRLKANISIYCAAILAEIGYSPREFLYYAVLAFSAGMLPCYIDAVEKPEGNLFPLEVSDIEYVGHNKRGIFKNES